MLVKHLIEKLKSFDPNMEIMLTQTNDETSHSMVESVKQEAVVFGVEDVPRKEWATVDCCVISDEL